MDYPTQGRLQRRDDFTGRKITTFKEVVWRHGLPGAVLGLLFFIWPQSAQLFSESITNATSNWKDYLSAGVGILVFCCIYSAVLSRDWQASQLVWIIYLGLISLWEEWVFRLALPQLLENVGMTVLMAVIVSNVLFGAAHYFTLRWKWPWCVAACLGGIALSRQMEVHGDLLWLVGLHWIGTFLNTPRAPVPR